MEGGGGEGRGGMYFVSMFSFLHELQFICPPLPFKYKLRDNCGLIL